MSRANVYYSVSPRIVPANKRTKVTIEPLYDHVRFKEDSEYKLLCVPVSGNTNETHKPDYPVAEYTISDGKMYFEFDFDREQEYCLVLQRIQDGEVRYEIELRMFALDEDLYTRSPLKGDIHMHTHYSDGTESPAFVAARCRQIGLDFMSISDHGQYAPSLEAMKAMAALDTDLKAFPAEEVHPPDNMVHMLNFGASISVNALFALPEYEEGVQEIMKELSGYPKEAKLHDFASCLYCFRKIRENGGLGVFCHPYWYLLHRYNIPETLTDMIFEEQPFDAIELMAGGQHGNNAICLARYYEEVAKGKKVPIVGVTDAHTSAEGSTLGWYGTLVFSPSDELGDIIDSIKDCYSVALESLPNEMVRPYGPFRLVKYAQFLVKEIFPEHDRLCNIEGTLMLAALAGDQSAYEQLKGSKGAVRRYYEKVWGSAK